MVKRTNILKPLKYKLKYENVKLNILKSNLDFSKPLKVIVAAGDAKGIAGGLLVLDVLDELGVEHTSSFKIHQQIPKPPHADANIKLLEELFDISLEVNEYDVFDLLPKLQEGGFGGFEDDHFKHVRMRKYIVPETGEEHNTLLITGHTGKGFRTYRTSYEFRQSMLEMDMKDEPFQEDLRQAPWGINLFITATALKGNEDFTDEAKVILKTVEKPPLFYNVNPSVLAEQAGDDPEFWTNLRALFNRNTEEVQRILDYEDSSGRTYLYHTSNLVPGITTFRELWDECNKQVSS